MVSALEVFALFEPGAFAARGAHANRAGGFNLLALTLTVLALQMYVFPLAVAVVSVYYCTGFSTT